MRATTRFDWNWMLVLMLTVFAIAPLTYPGFFQAHTGFLPVFQVTHIRDAPDWGRAADPLRGEGRLPYVIAWPFFAATGNGIAAIKWGYGLAFLLGAAGVYGWMRGHLGSKGALLAATVYTYLPWHLSAVYVRGAYAEAWLWAVWPLALWALNCVGGPRGWVWAAAALVALAASFWIQWGLAALFILGLTAAFVLWHRTSLRRWAVLAVVAVGVVLVGAKAPEARVPFADHFLYPYQLVTTDWGLSAGAAGRSDGLSFELGIAAVGLGLVGWVLHAGRSGVRDKGEAPLFRRVQGIALGLLAVILLLTLPPAALLWRVTGLDRLVTYPWQLLALAGLPLAFLAASTIRAHPYLEELPAWAALVALVLLASYPDLAPRFTVLDPGPDPVAALQPVGAPAPQILLLDRETVPPSEITPTLTLTLTWQAVEPVAADYTVFVHLLGPDGSKLAQRDSRPCGGECPTRSWQPGQIVVDRHSLALEPGRAHEPYRLAVGLYLLATGERAAVAGRDDETVWIDGP